MDELAERILKTAWNLARVNPLTPNAILLDPDVRAISGHRQKRTTKELLKCCKNLRLRRQFGKLRAAILVGLTLHGSSFVRNLERAGILLTTEHDNGDFGMFLAKLKAETDGIAEPGWTDLRSRIDTYLTFQILVNTARGAYGDASSLLKAPPRPAVRSILEATELSFRHEYLGTEVPTDFSSLLDELGPPEQIASVASLLIALANDFDRVEALDFAGPDRLSVDTLRSLMKYGKMLVDQFDIGKDISLFGYSLEMCPAPGPVFFLRPPFVDFEYYRRLGFIRLEASTGISRADAARKAPKAISLRGAADRFATRFAKTLAEVRDGDTRWRRVRINFPALKKLYEMVSKHAFFEDFVYTEQLARDFMVPLGTDDGIPQVTHALDLETFHGLWRYFLFLSLVDIALVRDASKNDSLMLLNSLVRLGSEEAIVELSRELGVSSEQGTDFLRVVSADVKQLGYFDLQYRPFLRIAQSFNPKTGRSTEAEVLHLPAVVCTSNVLRNVQAANNIRNAANASVFVQATAHALRATFDKVEINRPVEGSEGKSTDIDVILLEGETLYLFECKHSIPPTGPHEMRDLWEEIELGVEQLRTAMRIFEDAGRRQSYLAGWFPGTILRETHQLKIAPCVLCSHRIFAGLHYRGIPIRDFGSFSRLCDSGVIGMGGGIEGDEIVIRQYRITRGERFAAADLDDYLSPDSRLFSTFRPFMHPFTQLYKSGGITIAKESYVYAVDLETWQAHLESLGCIREPDRTQKLTDMRMQFAEEPPKDV